MLSMPLHWNALNEKYHEQEAETKIFQPFWEGIAVHEDIIIHSWSEEQLDILRLCVNSCRAA